ncbi:hypothetical protein [Streptomyces sp. NBC_00467]|uniref:hypothetical protein n=1 Tax=Streptomyces sp. NBC_00467 TaxID=2975752 RepID=UPI002E186A21
MPSQETTLKTAYADKVATDLAENTAEQDRIRAELEALQAQLTTLEADHTLLTNVSAALGNTGGAVPGPRRSVKKAATAAKRTTVKQASTAAQPTAKKTADAGKKTAGKGTPAAAKKAAAKTGRDKGPSLTELIHTHLTGQSEPRTAQEIAGSLAEAHPGRNVNVNLVRTTTERLVARSRVERVKQGSSVYYTARAEELAVAGAGKATAVAS